MPTSFADPSSASGYHTVEQLGDGGGAAAGFSNAAAFGGNARAQAQDNSSIHNFLSQQPPHPISARDTAPAPGQDSYSAYPFSHDNAYAAQSLPIAQVKADAPAGISADVQALLDSLTPIATTAPSAQYAAAQLSAQPPSQSNPSSLPAAATNLPPRPPAQDKPVTHPNYSHSDDIRSFHPHSQRATNGQARGSGPPPPLSMQRQEPSALPRAGAQSPTTTAHSQRQRGQRSSSPDDEDARWPPEVNRKYEDFLDQERKFVTEGQWDQFPVGSRLFIGKSTSLRSRDARLTCLGNLPTEKVTKRDIFHRFYRHGHLAQISIKQAYGFVQFMDAGACRRALDAEQGQAVRGRKMRK